MRKIKSDRARRVGLKTVEANSTEIVYKPVLSRDLESSKKRRYREANLPTVTLKYFKIEDIERLAKIANEVHANRVVISKNKTGLQRIAKLFDW